MVFLIIIIIPVARRWHLIVRTLGGSITYGHALRMVLMTVLLNQSVPSNLGGDAYRIVATSRTGMPWQRATLAAIVDRLMALVALALIGLLGIVFLLNLTGLEHQSAIIVGGALAIIGITLGAWLFFRSGIASQLSERVDILRRLIAALGTLLSDPAEAVYLLWLSILVQCITIGVMSLVAIKTGVDAPLPAMLSVCALGLLVARLPISYGGWGVREGMFVLGLTPLGISREAALAASITYGLTELAAAVVGGLLWIAMSVAADSRTEQKRQAS